MDKLWKSKIIEFYEYDYWKNNKSKTVIPTSKQSCYMHLRLLSLTIMHLGPSQSHREPQAEYKCSSTNVFGELWIYTGEISSVTRSCWENLNRSQSAEPDTRKKVELAWAPSRRRCGDCIANQALQCWAALRDFRTCSAEHGSHTLRAPHVPKNFMRS